MLPARNYPAVTHEQSAINLQFKSNTKSALHTAGNNAYHSVSQCVPSQRNALSRTTTWHNLLYPIQYTSSHDRLIPIAQNDLLGTQQATGTITATLWPYGYPLTWLVNPAKLFGMCQKLKTQNDQKRTWENLPACRQFDSFLECSPGCQVTTTLIRPSFSHWSLSLAHRCPTWPSTQLGSSDSLVLP